MALIGIDLGTTYSVVATFCDGVLTIMSNEEGLQTTPSIVFFPDEECTLDKAIAGSQAETSYIGHPDRGVRFIKRYMGRKGPDSSEGIMMAVGSRKYSPQEISSVILRKLVRDAEDFLFEGMEKVTDAVITVPAYFGPEERHATEEAAQMAGLTVRALVPEPIAAAIDYAKNQSTALAGRTVFVYDLGGGTFDATIMRIEQPEPDGPLAFWVLGKDGSIELGGSDWDRKLAEYVTTDYADQHDGDNPQDDVAVWDRLMMECERMKRLVSQKAGDESVDIPCSYQGVPHTTKISRTRFDELTQPLVNETLDKCSQLMERVFRAERLARRIADQRQGETGGPRMQENVNEWNRLVTECVAAVESLKQQAADGVASPSTSVRFRYQGEQQEHPLMPQDVDQMDVGGENPWSLIDEVLLVGGSTKLKSVQEQLEALTGIRPRRHQGVDFNVARGAAILAHTPEAWTNQTGLDDVAAPSPVREETTTGGTGGGVGLRHKIEQARGKKVARVEIFDTVKEGVGIEIHDSLTGQDRNFILVPANTTVGREYEASFGILLDHQTGVDIVLYKGNSESLQDGGARKLGMVSISGLPETTRSGEEVRVSLQVDGNGLVKGRAIHLVSGQSVDIDVKYEFRS